jgi:AcrR family transcriptional regulator
VSGVDSRLVRSRQALIAAITAALDEPAGVIPSITELCSAAGVSRPTFYQHFGDVPSLIEASAVDRTRALFDAVDPAAAGERWEISVPRVVRELLDGLLTHSDFYRRVLLGAGSRSFQEHVVAFLTERLLAFSPLGEAARAGADRARLERFATFLAAGTTWLVVGWLVDDASRPSIADAADDISELLVTGVAAQRHTSTL